jgi:hypothetical protein
MTAEERVAGVRGVCARHDPERGGGYGSWCPVCREIALARMRLTHMREQRYRAICGVSAALLHRDGDVIEALGISLRELTVARAWMAHRARCEQDAARDLRPEPVGL